MLARFTVGAWVLVALFFFFVPAAVAQTSPHTPSGLVPCGGVTAGNALGATECGLCDLVTLSQNIINFLLMLTVPLSVGLFAWAGVLYFTSGGNPTNITRAHGIFRSVIIGFVIALSAWLVVQTILHSLVKKNFFLTGTWNSLTCAPDGERPRESSITDMFSFLRGGVSGGAGGIGTTETPRAQTGDVYSDQAARAALAGACSGTTCFTYTSTGGCSNANQSSCTSLDGVQKTTVDRLVALQRECNCTINISGGTETGHGTSGAGNVHTNGSAFDISKGGSLDSVIMKYPSAGTVSIGGGARAPAHKAPDGTLFINEGSHWHLQLPGASI